MPISIPASCGLPLALIPTAVLAECQVVPGAVSNASGTASFHKNRQGESHHNQIGSLAFIHYKDSEDEMVEVKVATMDSMYGPNGKRARCNRHTLHPCVLSCCVV